MPALCFPTCTSEALRGLSASAVKSFMVVMHELIIKWVLHVAVSYALVTKQR